MPAIFRWPGQIPAAAKPMPSPPISICSPRSRISPAQIRPSIARSIDGRNLWPLLSGATDKGPHAHFHYLGGSAQPAAIQYRAIRDERWKFTVTVIAENKIAPAELYDLGADLGENFDRVKQHPEIATRLASVAQEFHDELRANIRPAGRRAATN